MDSHLREWDAADSRACDSPAQRFSLAVAAEPGRLSRRPDPVRSHAVGPEHRVPEDAPRTARCSRFPRMTLSVEEHHRPRVAHCDSEKKQKAHALESNMRTRCLASEVPAISAVVSGFSCA